MVSMSTAYQRVETRPTVQGGVRRDKEAVSRPCIAEDVVQFRKRGISPTVPIELHDGKRKPRLAPSRPRIDAQRSHLRFARPRCARTDTPDYAEKRLSACQAVAILAKPARF